MTSTEIHRASHCLKLYKQHSIALRQEVSILVSDPLLYFLRSMFCYVMLCHACNHIASKKGPGGYLIRVDLIRFPGSIPGAIKMKMWAS